ncbi:MAG TPA: FmdE family protein [Anaerolineales bacterium]|nr:FmdE family protein [Anaerolineales bacterium]
MTLEEILQQSAVRHKHLCPRQVLGARMALYAAEILGLELPRADKRLLVISETDGCAVDGLIAATACRVGSRTLRILDFGKVAAVFADTRTGETIRVVPRREARLLASEYAPGTRNRWEAMLNGYQVMPAGELFVLQSVRLDVPLSEVISKPGKQAICEVCGEEIINGREVMRDETVLCRTCAGEGFYCVVETMADTTLQG